MYSYFQHPNAVCMTYFEHMRLSLGFSATLFIGSFKAIVHAFLPNYFITSTTDVGADYRRDITSVYEPK